MGRPGDHRTRLTPELLLRAYAAGIFPMAETRDSDEIFWVDPRRRGVIPLEGFHVPRRLRRTVRRAPFAVTFDTAFDSVIAACAGTSEFRDDTWINPEIRRAYTELHELGFAHSVECWREDRMTGDELVGGLYGVSLGGAFFGESMFSRADDASKIALVHLVARLRLGGFVLLDTQFVTDHLRQFGTTEIPARDYLRRLEIALHTDAKFYSEVSPSDFGASVEAVLRQSTTQTS